MQTVQYMTKVIPPEITLIPDRVLAVDPSSNLILTKRTFFSSQPFQLSLSLLFRSDIIIFFCEFDGLIFSG
jgi:hypothetical protein